MSDARPISPGLKMALELGPVLAFFLGYFWVKDEVFTVGGVDYDGFIAVTVAFIPLLLLSTFVLWKLTGKLSKMQIVTAVLVVVFGGLTIWLNDERFLKVKPTIVFGLIAIVLGIGLMRGTSYLEYVMEDLMPLTSAGWMILTKRLAIFFFAMAVANEAIWRTMSTEAWVTIDTFGAPIAIFAFFMFQGRLIEEHALEKDDA